MFVAFGKWCAHHLVAGALFVTAKPAVTDGFSDRRETGNVSHFADCSRAQDGAWRGPDHSVDLGTGNALISRRLAQKLALHGPEVEIGLFGYRPKVSLITLPVLQLGPITVSNLKVFAIDMHPIEQELGIRLDAIIGLDAFAQTSFTIDYVRKVISFGVPNDAQTAIAMELRDIPSAYAVVEAEIEGKPLHLLLDTGACSEVLVRIILSPEYPKGRMTAA